MVTSNLLVFAVFITDGEWTNHKITLPMCGN